MILKSHCASCAVLYMKSKIHSAALYIIPRHIALRFTRSKKRIAQVAQRFPQERKNAHFWPMRKKYLFINILSIAFNYLITSFNKLINALLVQFCRF